MGFELHDRLDAEDLLVRFATALDTCDWPRYRSVFTDEIELDYSSWRPESVGVWPADDWVERATRLFPGLDATRHALSNVHVSLDGDRAAVRANVCADHVLATGPATEVFTLNGYYDDRCVRTAEGWRIEAKRLVVEWTVGDRALLERAARRVADGHPARPGPMERR
jgi:3-phenylpropionate/cinnamic acid dioxygenase small subunit